MALPVTLSSFIGREREIAELSEVVQRTRLLTLFGAGGVGKTRLAIRVAETASERSGHTPVFAELAPLADPGLVAHALANCLGVTEQPGQSVEDILKYALRQRDVLLLLDNCEHLVDACARLSDMLLRGCPSLRILATSRESLGVDGEVTWRVPSLSNEQAVLLFRARAHDTNGEVGDSEEALISDVCGRLDGIPLAIELAAARTRVLTLRQIAERLDNRLELLVGGNRTAPPRQQTLRAMIEWSFDLLDADEQLLFERLAVFAGGWSLEAAEVVSDFGSRTLELLTQLVAKSIVLADAVDDQKEMRYRLLATLREYAAERHAASEEEAPTRERHAAFFLELAEAGYRGSMSGLDLQWRGRLERDHDNVRAALRWLVERGEVAAALRLGGALARFWFFKGHLAEGRTWITRLLALPGADAESAGRAHCLVGLATFCMAQGEFERAESAGRDALAYFNRVGSQRDAAPVQYVLGRVARMRGDYQLARGLLDDAREKADAANDLAGLSLTLYGIAEVALEEGDLLTARQVGENVQRIASQIGWSRGTANALHVLCDVRYRQGELDAAERYAEQVLLLERELGGGWWIAASLDRLGHLSLERGDTVRARQLFADSLSLTRELADRHGSIRSLEGFAHLAVATGQHHIALRLAGAADAHRSRLGTRASHNDSALLNRWLRPARKALGASAEVPWREGKELEAETALAEALSLPAAIGDDDGDPLTPREREVAALVARGLANRQIADALVIALPTVERHVSNILARLDLHSRAQLVAWMLQRRRL